MFYYIIQIEGEFVIYYILYMYFGPLLAYVRSYAGVTVVYVFFYDFSVFFVYNNIVKK